MAIYILQKRAVHLYGTCMVALSLVLHPQLFAYSIMKFDII